jgi:hypothetical protein
MSSELRTVAAVLWVLCWPVLAAEPDQRDVPCWHEYWTCAKVADTGRVRALTVWRHKLVALSSKAVWIHETLLNESTKLSSDEHFRGADLLAVASSEDALFVLSTRALFRIGLDLKLKPVGDVQTPAGGGVRVILTPSGLLLRAVPKPSTAETDVAAFSLTGKLQGKWRLPGIVKQFLGVGDRVAALLAPKGQLQLFESPRQGFVSVELALAAQDGTPRTTVDSILSAWSGNQSSLLFGHVQVGKTDLVASFRMADKDVKLMPGAVIVPPPTPRASSRLLTGAAGDANTTLLLQSIVQPGLGTRCILSVARRGKLPEDVVLQQGPVVSATAPDVVGEEMHVAVAPEAVLCVGRSFSTLVCRPAHKQHTLKPLTDERIQEVLYVPFWRGFCVATQDAIWQVAPASGVGGPHFPMRLVAVPDPEVLKRARKFALQFGVSIPETDRVTVRRDHPSSNAGDQFQLKFEPSGVLVFLDAAGAPIHRGISVPSPRERPMGTLDADLLRKKAEAIFNMGLGLTKEQRDALGPVQVVDRGATVGYLRRQLHWGHRMVLGGEVEIMVDAKTGDFTGARMRLVSDKLLPAQEPPKFDLEELRRIGTTHLTKRFPNHVWTPAFDMVGFVPPNSFWQTGERSFGQARACTLQALIVFKFKRHLVTAHVDVVTKRVVGGMTDM